jgi:hypothetical protein
LFHDLPLSKYLQKRLGCVKKGGNTCSKGMIKKGKEIAHVSKYSKKESGKNNAKRSIIIKMLITSTYSGASVHLTITIAFHHVW